ncbi:hypothetical protein BH10CYA1_BH10CYA1_08860 [soil metagenome]
MTEEKDNEQWAELMHNLYLAVEEKRPQEEVDKLFGDLQKFSSTLGLAWVVHSFASLAGLYRSRGREEEAKELDVRCDRFVVMAQHQEMDSKRQTN